MESSNSFSGRLRPPHSLPFGQSWTHKAQLVMLVNAKVKNNTCFGVIVVFVASDASSTTGPDLKWRRRRRGLYSSVRWIRGRARRHSSIKRDSRAGSGSVSQERSVSQHRDQKEWLLKALSLEVLTMGLTRSLEMD